MQQELLPFNSLDGAFLNIERAAEPWSIHLELWVEGELEPERLKAALEHAMQLHPMARARVAPYHPGSLRNNWQVDAQADLMPLEIHRAEDDTALSSIRDNLASQALPRERSPLFRVSLVHHPQGDRLMLQMNHVLADGMACFRLLQSMWRHYGGLPDAVPDLDLREIRDLRNLVAPRSILQRVQRLRVLVDHLLRSTRQPTRIHSEGVENGSPETGYGCVLLHLSAEDSARVMARRRKPATVNDLLLATMATTIVHWNQQWDQPPGRISITMPVNLRPSEWWSELVSNFSTYVAIHLDPDEQGDIDQFTDEVFRQTSFLKQVGAAGVLVDVLAIPKFYPSALKAQLKYITPTLGRNLVDSTWVSNLGRLESLPPIGDAGAVKGIYFTPPAPMPMGMSVGIDSYDGQFCLGFRYSKALLDYAAAERFARGFVSVLLGESRPF